jgi:hypothetical protein
MGCLNESMEEKKWSTFYFYKESEVIVGAAAQKACSRIGRSLLNERRGKEIKSQDRCR